MIASSTMIPMVRMKPNNEIMLIEAPMNGINRNAPRIDTGIPSVTQNASRGSRKRPSRSRTSTNPRTAFRSRRSMRLRKNSEASSQTAIRMSSGNTPFQEST